MCVHAHAHAHAHDLAHARARIPRVVHAPTSSEYGSVKDLEVAPQSKSGGDAGGEATGAGGGGTATQGGVGGGQLVLRQNGDTKNNSLALSNTGAGLTSSALALNTKRPPPKVATPDWHSPWKLKAVVSGHLGWVRAIGTRLSACVCLCASMVRPSAPVGV